MCLACDQFNVFQLQMKHQHFSADVAVGNQFIVDFKSAMNSTFGLLTALLMPL